MSYKPNLHISEVITLQPTLDALQSSMATMTAVEADLLAMEEELASKAEDEHTHIIDHIENLQDELDSLETSVSGKFNTPSGTTAQYLRGDGTLATFPSIPSSQVNSDWNSSSGLSQILNKPSLATVATSGSYNDLSSKPTIPTTFDQLSDGTTNKAFTATLLTKLNGIATAATANDTDANLKNRANHTGTQTASTISDFTESAQDAVGAMVSADFSYNDAGNALSLRTRSFNNTPGRSIVTGTGATGFQPSSTRDAIVNYSVTITTAVQIGLATNVDGYVVLEIAPTNSATAGDWVEIARTPQAQNIGIALALSSTQKGGGNLTGGVPAGYYAKIRSVNVAGTPTYAYNSGQEVLA